jgi:hypothetical protein
MGQKVADPLGVNVTRAKALETVRNGNFLRGPHPAVVLKYKKKVGKHRSARRNNYQTLKVMKNNYTFMNSTSGLDMASL